jgi:hypothetical protein
VEVEGNGRVEPLAETGSVGPQLLSGSRLLIDSNGRRNHKRERTFALDGLAAEAALTHLLIVTPGQSAPAKRAGSALTSVPERSSREEWAASCRCSARHDRGSDKHAPSRADISDGPGDGTLAQIGRFPRAKRLPRCR